MNQDERESRWAAGMRAAMAGDGSAYRSLLQELSVWLRGLMRSRLSRSGHGDIDVEDAVQETLLAIHLKRHTWRSDEPISPWVAAIARNKLVDQLRRRGRRSELPLDDLIEDGLPAQCEESLANHDVARLMSGLNTRQRDIVQLVAIEGHSARIAAGKLGMTEGALRVALHRTLRSLAQSLKGQVSG